MKEKNDKLNNNNIKIFSFFSGVGFLDLGFEKENFEIVFVNEYNNEFLKAYKYARTVMGINPPRLGYYCGDINSLLIGEKRKKLKDYVLQERKNGIVGFIGGPPCPDFSVAGKNAGITGKNGALTNSYKRLILDQEPDFFVFENVKGLWKTQKHRKEYDKIKDAFRRKGYVLTDRLVNALDYGVPQDRERIILVGIKYSLINEDKRKAVNMLKKDFSWGNNPLYNFEKRSNCKWPDREQFIQKSEREMPKDIIPELCVEYWFKKNNVSDHYNSTDYFAPKAKDRFKSIEEGDISRKSFKRLHRWRYSPTVAYGNNEVHLHPYYERRLSVAEALSIQSLPKEFIITKELSKSDMFKTVGNGVPFLLSKAIAHSIREYLEHNVRWKG